MQKAEEAGRGTARFQMIFWAAAVLLFFYFLSLIKGILLPFVVGILAAYFLDPAVGRLCRRFRLSRNASAATITTAFFTLAIILCVLLVPLILHQLAALVRDMPGYIADVQAKYGTKLDYFLSSLSQDQVSAIRDAASNFTGTLASWAGGVLTDMLKSGLALLDLLSLVFLTPIVAFYLLRDWDRLVMRFDELLPRQHEETILAQLRAIDRTLSGFIRGQTNVCLIMAAYYGILLTLAGLKFGLGLGIMTGLLLFIPFVGFATCCTLSMAVALFQFGLEPHALAVAAVYLCGMVLEGSVLTPRLVGGEVGLHPLWIIFGMLCGGALFGFVGVLISVPVTAVSGVLVRFVIAKYKRSDLYLNPGQQ